MPSVTSTSGSRRLQTRSGTSCTIELCSGGSTREPISLPASENVRKLCSRTSVNDQPVSSARAHDLLSMIDNTFATPVNFRPLEMGFDLSIHSGTKYLNGHDDIAAGCVIGRAEQVERIRHRLNHLGGSLDPHACFLLNRGLMTLALRVRQQNTNALQLAHFLAGHSPLGRVLYHGWENHPHSMRTK